MTDINLPLDESADNAEAGEVPQVLPQTDNYDLIELLFFAYRDFISEPDEILAGYGFGRAHHRVLHFVDRHPGLSVADLLEILKITKQSLARVLKQLVDEGFIEQREGKRDRRQRLLHATDRGINLARELAGLQSARIAKALDNMREEDRKVAVNFLLRLINDTERRHVIEMVGVEGADRNTTSASALP